MIFKDEIRRGRCCRNSNCNNRSMFLSLRTSIILFELSVFLFIAITFSSSNVGWAMSVTGESEVNASAVVGNTAQLPCDIKPPSVDDRTHLVLWYKQDSGNPIYTLDLREKKAAITTQFPPEDIRSRVTFYAEVSSPYLLIKDVRAEDQGIYRCRVDFKRSRTRNGLVNLNVVVPPATPSILGEKGLDLGPVIGPYNEGASLFLSCEVVRGRPPPRVTWWRDSTMLDDSYEVTSLEIVRNDLMVQSLSRNDIRAVFTCQASNNNITPPVTSSVTVDMNLKPLEITILDAKRSLSANKHYTIMCRSTGSRPPPIIAWWKDQKRLTQTDEALSADGNVTTSIAKFIPVSDDNGKYISCRAENPAIQGSSIQDGWILDVHYAPVLSLVPGESVRLHNIREGDDVYLECNIRANPTVLRVEWKFQGKLLVRNNSSGVSASNQSLILQNVRIQNSGSYSCVATNVEGEGESNRIIIQVKHAPVCHPNLKTVFRVAREETVKIVCEVEAYPANVSFRWKTNKTNDQGSEVDLHFTQEQTRSTLTYTPRTEKDFGNFYCWAGNDMGFQKMPCIFTVEPAGPPDPVSNCSVVNQTETSISVECSSGYDGGLPQTFICEVHDASDGEVKRTVTSPKPSFYVDDLNPGLSYVFSLSATNRKGRSEVSSLETATARKSSSLAHGSSEKMITTVLGVVIGIVVAFALIGITILIVVRGKGSANHSKHKDYQPEHADRSNVPLRKDMDDCLDNEEKSPDIICNTTGEQEFPSVKVRCLQKWAYGDDSDSYDSCLRPHHNHHPVLGTFTGTGCAMENNVGSTGCRYPPRKIQPLDDSISQPDIQMQANHHKFCLGDSNKPLNDVGLQCLPPCFIQGGGGVGGGISLPHTSFHNNEDDVSSVVSNNIVGITNNRQESSV